MSAPKARCACRMPVSECVCDDDETERGDAEAEALTPEVARHLAESSVAALKPGDVLAVRVPFGVPADQMHHLRAYAKAVEAETGIKVAFIPGEEFSHITLNVTVGLHGTTPEQVAQAVQREVSRHLHAGSLRA